jgi:HK97 family phage major capsid protein
MSYKDKLGEAQALFAKAKEIIKDPEADTETKNTVEAILEEARKLKGEANQLKEIEKAAKAMQDEIAEAEKEKETKKEEDTPGEQKANGDGPGEFKTWDNYLNAIYYHLHPKADVRQADPRLVPFREKRSEAVAESKQMVESVGASGGFLVPTEFLPQLQAIQGEMSNVRGRATIIRMRRRAIQIPVLDQTGTTAGIPHWFGGMQFYWAEEAAAKTETEAAFRQIELVAHKLIGYTRASDELLDDSAISLTDFLSGPMGMAGGIAWMEDYAFYQGTGAGQPLGVINAGATINEPRLAAGAIGFDDLADMMEDFLPTGNGQWTITQSAMSEIIQMNGPAANPSYIWQPNARDGVPGFILGFPVIWSEKVPLIGTTGDVVLADWRYYLIGDRQATTLETTQYDYWRYDQTSWRAVHRVDGQPWLNVPLTYQDGTTQVSPFVILAGPGGS